MRLDGPNPAVERTSTDLADGSYWTYSYDALGQVTGGVRHAPGGEPLPGMVFGYAFDDIGNRQSSEVSGAASGYTANPLNQYTRRTIPGVIGIRGTANPDAVVTVRLQDTVHPTARLHAWYYAAVPVDNSSGPVTAEVTVTGVRPAAGPNGEDVVTEVSGSRDAAPALQEFTYDLDGNMTSDGVRTYTWTRLHASLVSGITPWQDGENRLVAVKTSATAPDAVRVEFVYDFQGRRRLSRAHAWAGDHWALAATRIFSYDGWNCIHEGTIDHTQVPAAVTETAWLWGLDLSGSMQGAGGVGGLISAAQTEGQQATCRFVAYDGNGNITALVDAADASVVARYDYSPLGMTVLADGPAAAVNPWRFSTKYHDTETALVYYGYRYYSPELGRWINRDPIEERGGEGLCRFVQNTPNNRFDPHGLVVAASTCDAVLAYVTTLTDFTGNFALVEHRSPEDAAEERAEREAKVAAGECPVSLVCTDCEHATQRYDAWREPAEGGGSHVVINYEKMSDYADLWKNVYHELQHAKEGCANWNQGNDCSKCLCRELSAEFCSTGTNWLESKLMDSWFSCTSHCRERWPNPASIPTDLLSEAQALCGTGATAENRWDNVDRCWNRNSPVHQNE